MVTALSERVATQVECGFDFCLALGQDCEQAMEEGVEEPVGECNDGEAVLGESPIVENSSG